MRNFILFQFCLPCQRDHADDCERIMQKIAAPLPEVLPRRRGGAENTLRIPARQVGKSLAAGIINGCILLVAMLAPATIRAQTPDTHSIQKIYYRPENCKQTSRPEKNVVISNGVATACSRVLVYFAAVTWDPGTKAKQPPPALIEVSTRTTFVPPQHPDAPGICFRFQPADCRPLLRDIRFVCKNVWWTEGPCAQNNAAANPSGPVKTSKEEK